MLAKTPLAAFAGPVAAVVAAVAILVPLAVTRPIGDDPQPMACQGPQCGG